jgi:Ca-activated chloride channel family protein
VTIKKDAKGQTVITKLHPEILSDLAKKTGGSYFQSENDNRSIASSILKQIASIGSNQYNQKILSGYKSQFQFFLFPALLLLILELFIRNRKGK